MTDRAPKIQNFTLPAGDDLTFFIDIGPDGEATLEGADIHWRAFGQSHGIPDFDSGAIIEKSIGNGLVIINEEAQQVSVTLERQDTVGLLGNFYHETNVEDVDGLQATPTVGMMTLTRTAGDEV